MIVGIGIDVCSIERYEAMVTRRPGIAARLLTPAELGERVECQAARFAAKEALAKALGAPGGLAWMDAEIRKDDSGQPRFVITGTVAARADELGIRRIHVSLSHDAGVAMAFVVCES